VSATFGNVLEFKCLLEFLARLRERKQQAETTQKSAGILKIWLVGFWIPVV